MTNYERIKQMSVDEMAKVFDEILECDICLSINSDCANCNFADFCDLENGHSKEWLESEAEV